MTRFANRVGAIGAAAFVLWILSESASPAHCSGLDQTCQAVAGVGLDNMPGAQWIAQVGGSSKARPAPPASASNPAEPPRRLPGPPGGQTSVTFYVSASDGDDDANGRASKRNCPPQQCGGGDGPFATF